MTRLYSPPRPFAGTPLGPLEHLENSLRMMRTDYIDIYQLHQIAQEKDWETVTGPGGAMEAVTKAHEQGKVRYIGVTSHNLAMAVKLVRYRNFQHCAISL